MKQGCVIVCVKRFSVVRTPTRALVLVLTQQRCNDLTAVDRTANDAETRRCVALLRLVILCNTPAPAPADVGTATATASATASAASSNIPPTAAMASRTLATQ